MFPEEFRALLAGPPGECLDTVDGMKDEIFGHLIAVVKARPETLSLPVQMNFATLLECLWSTWSYRLLTADEAAELVKAIEAIGEGWDDQQLGRLRIIGELVRNHFNLEPTPAGA